MSNRAIDPVCPQAISPMKVTLFPSVMLCVTNNNIPLKNGHDTSYCIIERGIRW